MQFGTNLEPLIPEPLQKDDADFMAQALRLAHLARLNSHPNPAVGCLLVRQNEVIAKGYTQPAGQATANQAPESTPRPAESLTK